MNGSSHSTQISLVDPPDINTSKLFVRLYDCPVCLASGDEIIMGCCGECDHHSECCGNPEARIFPCPCCHGEKKLSNLDLLEYAERTSQPELYALCESHILLESILIDHPARLPARYKNL